MNCPKCGYSFSVVIDCRDSKNAKRRRRKCSGCGFKYNVVELTEAEYGRYKKILRYIEKIRKQTQEIMDGNGDFED